MVRPAATAADGTDVRFTKKGDSVYAFFLNRPAGNRLTLPGIQSVEGTRIAVLGSNLKTSFQQQGTDVVVDVAGKLAGKLCAGREDYADTLAVGKELARGSFCRYSTRETLDSL